MTSVVIADQFVSVTDGAEDLHLKVSSEAASTGIALSPSLVTDIDGDARPGGAGWDMGADEI